MYTDSIMPLTKYDDLDVVNQTIDAIRKYGDHEDLEKISAFAWMKQDDRTARNLIITTRELEKPDVTKWVTYKNIV